MEQKQHFEAFNSGVKTVEFCYKWPDGRIEVRYRRDEGTADCKNMQNEIDTMMLKQGEECPYFYRTV